MGFNDDLKRKKYRTPDGSYDRMLKKKWDASLETGLESGIFKHDHKGHQVKDFPGEGGWVGVYCPARIAAKRPSPSFDSGNFKCLNIERQITLY